MTDVLPQIAFVSICVGFTIILLQYLLYTGRLLGWIVCRVLSYFLKQNGEYVRISSITVAPVGGRIFFKDVKYVTRNSYVRVIDGYITFDWYIAKPVKKGNGHSPGRLSVHINGLEYTFYGNTEKYRHLRELFELRTSNMGASESKDASEVATGDAGRPTSPPLASVGRPAKESKPAEGSKNMYERLMDSMGAVNFTIHGAKVYIGNPKMAYFMMVYFYRCRGKHCLVGPNLAEDLGRGVLEAQMEGFSLKVLHNSVKARKREKQKESKAVLQDMAKELVHELKYNIGMDDVEDTTERLGLKRGRNDSCMANSLPPSPVVLQGLRQAEQYGVVMTDAQIRILYYWDIPGIESRPVPKTTDALPKQGLEMEISVDTITYGPWLDFQRNELKNLFYPQTFENWRLYKFVPGMTRPYGCFEMRLNFVKDVSLQIPFRHKDIIPKLPKGIQWSGREGNLAISMGKGSFIVYNWPYLAMSEYVKPSASMLWHVTELKTTTSLNNVTFLKAAQMEMLMDIHFSHEWGGQQDWDLTFKFYNSEMFLLFDHYELFMDLKDDWTHVRQMYFNETLVQPQLQDYLKKWQPVIYNYDILFLDNIDVHFIANEKNLVHPDHHDHFSMNSYVTISAQKMAIDINVPNLSCPVLTENEGGFSYDISIHKVKGIISAPITHPIHEALKPGCPFVGNFLEVEEWTFTGNYTMHYTMPARASKILIPFVDSCVFDIQASGVTVMALAQYIKIFMNAWRNFFQEDKHVVTPADLLATLRYINRRCNVLQLHRKFKWQELRQNEFELYIDFRVHGLEVVLPSDMDPSCKKAHLSLYELTLSIHNMSTASDFCVSTSPVTLRVDTPFETSPEDYFLGIDSLSLHMAKYFNQGMMYYHSLGAKIGYISGQLHVVQLAVLVEWASNFIAIWPMEDNHCKSMLAALSGVEVHDNPPGGPQNVPYESRCFRSNLWGSSPRSTSRRTQSGMDTEHADEDFQFMTFLNQHFEDAEMCTNFAFKNVEASLEGCNMVLGGALGYMNIVLEDSCHYGYNTLNDSNTHSRTTFNVPSIQVRFMVTKREDMMAADTPGDHVEAGGVTLHLRGRHMVCHPNVGTHFEKQRQFLMKHDVSTRRLAHINEISDRWTDIIRDNSAIRAEAMPSLVACAISAACIAAGIPPDAAATPDRSFRNLLSTIEFRDPGFSGPMESASLLATDTPPMALAPIFAAVPQSSPRVQGIPSYANIPILDLMEASVESVSMPDVPTNALQLTGNPSPPAPNASTYLNVNPVTSSSPAILPVNEPSSSTAFVRPEVSQLDITPSGVLLSRNDSGRSVKSDSGAGSGDFYTCVTTHSFGTCMSHTETETGTEATLVTEAFGEDSSDLEDVDRHVRFASSNKLDNDINVETKEAEVSKQDTIISNVSRLSNRSVTIFSPQEMETSKLEPPTNSSHVGPSSSSRSSAWAFHNLSYLETEQEDHEHGDDGYEDDVLSSSFPCSLHILPLSEYHRLLLSWDLHVQKTRISALQYRPGRVGHLMGTHSLFPCIHFLPVKKTPRHMQIHSSGQHRLRQIVVPSAASAALPVINTKRRSVRGTATKHTHIDFLKDIEIFITPELVLMLGEWLLDYVKTENQLKRSCGLDLNKMAEQANLATGTTQPKATLYMEPNLENVISTSIPHFQLRIFQALQPYKMNSTKQISTQLVLNNLQMVVSRTTSSCSDKSLTGSLKIGAIYTTMQVLNKSHAVGSIPLSDIEESIQAVLIPDRPVVGVFAVTGLHIRSKDHTISNPKAVDGKAADIRTRKAAVTLGDVSILSTVDDFGILHSVLCCWNTLLPVIDIAKTRTLVLAEMQNQQRSRPEGDQTISEQVGSTENISNPTPDKTAEPEATFALQDKRTESKAEDAQEMTVLDINVEVESPSTRDVDGDEARNNSTPNPRLPPVLDPSDVGRRISCATILSSPDSRPNIHRTTPDLHTKVGQRRRSTKRSSRILPPLLQAQFQPQLDSLREQKENNMCPDTPAWLIWLQGGRGAATIHWVFLMRSLHVRFYTTQPNDMSLSGESPSENSIHVDQLNLNLSINPAIGSSKHSKMKGIDVRDTVSVNTVLNVHNLTTQIDPSCAAIVEELALLKEQQLGRNATSSSPPKSTTPPHHRPSQIPIKFDIYGQVTVHKMSLRVVYTPTNYVQLAITKPSLVFNNRKPGQAAGFKMPSMSTPMGGPKDADGFNQGAKDEPVVGSSQHPKFLGRQPSVGADGNEHEWQNGLLFCAESILLEYMLDIPLQQKGPFSVMTITMQCPSNKAVIIHHLNVRNAGGVQKNCINGWVGSLNIIIPNNLDAMEVITLGVHEYYMHWMHAIGTIRESMSGGGSEQEREAPSPLDLYNQKSSGDGDIHSRDGTLLYMGLDICNVGISISVHPDFDLCYHLTRVLATYHSTGHQTSNIRLHIFRSHLVSRDVHSQDTAYADMPNGVKVPEVCLSAVETRDPVQQIALVQVSVSVQRMHTHMTSHILNQLITLCNKLGKDAMDIVEHIQASYYASFSTDQMGSPAFGSPVKSSPAISSSVEEIRALRVYNVKFFLAGVCLNATSEYSKLYLDSGPVTIQAWDSNSKCPSTIALIEKGDLKWEISLSSARLGIRDRGRQEKSKGPSIPFNLSLAMPLEDPVSSDEDEAFTRYPSKADMGLREDPNTPIFDWGYIQSSITISNQIAHSDKPSAVGSPIHRAAAHALPTKGFPAPWDVSRQSSPFLGSSAGGETRGGSSHNVHLHRLPSLSTLQSPLPPPGPTSPERSHTNRNNVHVHVNNAKVFARPGCTQNISLVVDEYNHEFKKFTAEVQKHKKKVQETMHKFKAAEKIQEMQEKIEKAKQQYLEGLSQDPGSFITSAMVEFCITNTSLQIPIGEGLFFVEQIDKWLREDCTRPGESPHAHTLDCINLSRFIASHSIGGYISTISFSTLTDHSDPKLVKEEAKKKSTKLMASCQVSEVLLYFDEGTQNLKPMYEGGHLLGGYGCLGFGTPSVFARSKNGCRLARCEVKLHADVRGNEVGVKSTCDVQGLHVKVNASILPLMQETLDDLFPEDTRIPRKSAVSPHMATSKVSSAPSFISRGNAHEVDEDSKFHYNITCLVNVEEGECAIYSLKTLPSSVNQPAVPSSFRRETMKKDHPLDLIMAVPIPGWSLSTKLSNISGELRDPTRTTLLAFTIRSHDLTLAPIVALFWKELGLQKDGWARKKQDNKARIVNTIKSLEEPHRIQNIPGSVNQANANLFRRWVPLPSTWLAANTDPNEPLSWRKKSSKCNVRSQSREPTSNQSQSKRNEDGHDEDRHKGMAITCRVEPFKVTFNCAPVSEVYLCLSLCRDVDILVNNNGSSSMFFFTANDFEVKLSAHLKAGCLSLVVPTISLSMLRHNVPNGQPQDRLISGYVGNMVSTLSTPQMAQLYTIYLLWKMKAHEAQAAFEKVPPKSSESTEPRASEVKNKSLTPKCAVIALKLASVNVHVYDDSYGLAFEGKDLLALHYQSLNPGTGPDRGKEYKTKAMYTKVGHMGLIFSKRLTGKLSLDKGFTGLMVSHSYPATMRNQYWLTKMNIVIPKVLGDLDFLQMRKILNLAAMDLVFSIEDVMAPQRPYHVCASGKATQLHVLVTHDLHQGTIPVLKALWENVNNVTTIRRKEAEWHLRSVVQGRDIDTGSPPSAPSDVKRGTKDVLPSPAEFRLAVDDFKFRVVERSVSVDLTLIRLAMEFAVHVNENEKISRVVDLSTDRWSLSYQESLRESVCAACNGVTRTQLLTERVFTEAEVIYSFLTHFEKELETEANMAELKATTDTLRDFFTAGAMGSKAGPSSSTTVRPLPEPRPEVRYVAVAFDFAPAIKWLGPLTAPFQTFISWLGLSYEALPKGLDKLCDILQNAMARPHATLLAMSHASKIKTRQQGLIRLIKLKRLNVEGNPNPKLQTTKVKRRKKPAKSKKTKKSPGPKKP